MDSKSEQTDGIQAVHFSRRGGQSLCSAACFGPEVAEKARSFHRSFPTYRETPLVSLSHLAGELGVAAIYVKDESARFGLNAFKVLGGSYAIGNYIAKKLGVSITELPYEKLVSRDTCKPREAVYYVGTLDRGMDSRVR